MGMDVYGDAPSAPEGEYFRNNVWWWRPLADYVCQVAPSITSGCECWHSNDGDGLSAGKSVKLAKFLQVEIDAGRTQQYADAYQARIDSIPREVCDLCAGTGIRTDAVGQQMKQPERAIDEPGHPRHGQTGWCNGCDGIGMRKAWEASYPFSVENVQEFVTFLHHCGGFRIC